jgi:Tol biopolymer transport system component
MSSAPAILLFLLLLGALPCQGQFSAFGKNKVQYFPFAWQKMATPHFDLYFYPEEAPLANFTAAVVEEKFADLERKFGHTVQRRVPLILYSSHIYFEQTNIIPSLLPEGVAGFTEFLKGRVALPLSNSLPEFERVLHHELVHVFMYDRISQVMQRRGLYEHRPAPLWFSEGLAEHWSGEIDPFGDMILRDALFSGQLASIAQMDQILGTYQMYKEGQSICAHLARAYGEEIFARLLENWWLGEDFEEVFKLCTGQTLAELDEAWLRELRLRYLGDVAASDPPDKQGKALTSDGSNLKPALVPGDSLSFVHFSNRQGYTSITRSPLAGGKGQVVVEGERSADFESFHPLSTGLAVSADGRCLAFVAKRQGQDNLYVWDLRLGREAHRFEFDDLVALASPSFSPEGGRLVFSGTGQGGFADLYTVEVESGKVEQLTADWYHDRDPAWSPDGQWIAFSSDRGEGGRQGVYHLFLWHLPAARLLPLSGGEGSQIQPAWDPKGERLAYCAEEGGIYNLQVARVEAGPESARLARRQLTRVLGGAFAPAWLPGDQGLLYTGFEKGAFQIFRQTAPLADSAAWEQAEAVPGWPLTGSAEPYVRMDYHKKMSLDVAQSQISQDPLFGTSGGIQVGVSDVLGNDQYYFILSHISGSQTGFFDGLNLAFSRLHLGRRVNFSWGGFHLNDRFTSLYGRFVREKRTGGYLELSYPFSRFKRVDAEWSLRHADIDRQFEGQKLSGWLVSNTLSFTHDSSLWILTGPLAGTRYSLGLGQTVDFRSSRRFNLNFSGDFRHYQRLGQRNCLALRLMGRHSRGEVPEYVSMGGSWTLRGYPWRSLWGRNLVLANGELRFPLVDRLVIGLPFGDIDLSAFRGAFFADAGNAWNEAFGDWKGSLGGGVRLGLGGVFVFRLDGARRTDFKSVGNHTDWDFFFGWDF